MGTKNSSTFSCDVCGNVARALEVLERGVTFDDLPLLALAALRATMESLERLSPYLVVWEQLPRGAIPVDAPESADVIAAAAALAGANLDLYRAQFAPTEDEVDARCTAFLADVDGDGSRARFLGERHVRAEHESRERARRADVAVRRRQLDDALRLLWTIVKSHRP